MAKSYWIGVSLVTEGHKDSCRSWFSPMADEMTPYKAEILCDIETDREKKLRSFMTDANGQHYKLERTLGRKTFSISCKKIQSPVSAGAA